MKNKGARGGGVNAGAFPLLIRFFFIFFLFLKRKIFIIYIHLIFILEEDPVIIYTHLTKIDPDYNGMY